MPSSENRARVWAFFGALFAGVYLLNPTLGIFELIPDNIPVIGNLDEVGATALLWTCVRALRRRSIADDASTRVEPSPPNPAERSADRR